MTGQRSTPAAIANRQARNRARQRARHDTARDHRGFYARRLTEITGGARTATSADRNRAESDTAAAFPNEYQVAYRRELERETLVTLPIGSSPIYPCGTEKAMMRHRRRGEPHCDECIAGHEARAPERQCHTCDRPYRSTKRARFCSDDCYWLWSRCLRYYEVHPLTRTYRDNATSTTTQAAALARKIGVNLGARIERARRDGTVRQEALR
jgi:hypothetical protein